MKKHWELDELIEHFTLMETEKQLVESNIRIHGSALLFL